MQNKVVYFLKNILSETCKSHKYNQLKISVAFGKIE